MEYTKKYFELEQKFKNAEIAFDANPNKKTAKKLSDARKNLNDLSYDEKFTFDSIQKVKKHQSNYMNNLFNTLASATNFENGFTDEKQFSNELQIIDKIYPTK